MKGIINGSDLQLRGSNFWLAGQWHLELTAVNSLYIQLSVYLLHKGNISKVLKSQLVAFEMYIDFKLLCAVKQM